MAKIYSILTWILTDRENFPLEDDFILVHYYREYILKKKSLWQM